MRKEGEDCSRAKGKGNSMEESVASDWSMRLDLHSGNLALFCEELEAL